MDDMLLVGKNIEELNDSFDMKDLGDASHILGIRIEQDRDKKLLYLSQTEYIDKILKCFNMEGGEGIEYSIASICETLPK